MAAKKTEPTLFSFEDAKIGNLDSGGLSQFLKPAPNYSRINVVDSFQWTLTPKEGRTETPNIFLDEYRILQSSLISSSRYYTAGLSQQVVSSKNPYLKEKHMTGYAGLFDFNTPTFKYVFPYFGDVAFDVSSSWTTLDILEKARNAIGAINEQAGGAVDLATGVAGFAYEASYPRVGIMDRPKLWESSDFRSINVKFPLFNTVTETDIGLNWQLCYLLTYQNMFNKRDFITAIPPVFYTVYIPGQFFSIAMYVSNLKIYNRGNMRLYNVLGKWRNIPDVYEIDITLTDMVMPSQNMLRAIFDEDPIKVQKINQGVPVPEIPEE